MILIIAVQVKRSCQKGCKLFVVQIFSVGKANDNARKEEIKVLEKYIVL